MRQNSYELLLHEDLHSFSSSELFFFCSIFPLQCALFHFANPNAAGVKEKPEEKLLDILSSVYKTWEKQTKREVLNIYTECKVQKKAKQ